MANYMDKYKIKDEGLQLEKSEPEELDAEIEALKKQKDAISKRIAELENKKIPKKTYHNVSNIENKAVYEIPFNMKEFNIKKPPIYEYDPTLDELENVKRKNILIQYGKLLTQNKQTDEAIRYYKYLCNNTYFSNDWYPYRQLTILYNKTKDYHTNLLNIKKLFRSKTYLNRYQFIWFSEKIRKLLEKVNIADKEINEWFEYYQTYGALNEKNSNKFLADKFMKVNENTIIVITDEYFNHKQERYALEETGRIYERVGNYELAISHYKKIITENEFNYYQFYQRICYCLEKIKDYNCELKVIKLYYTNPPIQVTEVSDKWFEKRLNNVNAKLKTNYSVDDLKSEI